MQKNKILQAHNKMQEKNHNINKGTFGENLNKYMEEIPFFGQMVEKPKNNLPEPWN